MKPPKINGVEIDKEPESITARSPQVRVTFENGTRKTLFSYFPDEISFQESELMGLTEAEAMQLKYTKDRAYLTGRTSTDVASPYFYEESVDDEDSSLPYAHELRDEYEPLRRREVSYG